MNIHEMTDNQLNQELEVQNGLFIAATDMTTAANVNELIMRIRQELKFRELTPKKLEPLSVSITRGFLTPVTDRTQKIFIDNGTPSGINLR